MEAKKKYLVCERRSVFALLTLSAGMMGCSATPKRPTWC